VIACCRHGEHVQPRPRRRTRGRLLAAPGPL